MLKLVVREKPSDIQGHKWQAVEVLACAVRIGEAYQITSHQSIPNDSQVNTIEKWQPPPVGVLKVNVDAAILENKMHFGIGIVGRDHNGIILFAEGRCVHGRFTPHIAELLTVREGVLMAMNSGWTLWIVETDALKAIQALHAHAPFSMDEPISENIRTLCSRALAASINHSPRITNQVAHDLARKCLFLGNNVAFKDTIPLFDVSEYLCKT